MKGVGRLVKNELIKIFGQLSWKIITIIILVLAVLGPILSSILGSFVYSVSDNFYRELYNEAVEGSIEKEYYGVLADAEDFFNENGITYEDWRYEEYFSTVESLFVSVKAYELVKDGRDPNEVFDWFDDGNITRNYTEDGDIEITYYDDMTGESMEITAEIASSEYETNKAQLEELKDTIVNGTIKSYAEGHVEGLKQTIENYEEYLAEAKAAYEADETKYYDYRSWQYNVYAYKASLAVWEVLIDASREDEAWLLNTAKQTFNYTDKGPQLVTLDRESFETEEFLSETYGSYERYCEVMDKQFYDNVAAIDILKYSAENGKPLPGMYPDSARNTIFSAVADNASTVLLLCIILAATIVANEHMTGTVRLLLIRPRARWKILLSKLLAVVIYGLGTFAAASVLSVIMALILNGSGDMLVPMLVYRHGTVKEVAPVIYILVKTLINSLPNLLIMSLAFFLSVAVKKVVFSVAIPMMVTMFGSIASSLTMLFFTRVPVLEWTLLPYFVIDSYTTDVVTRTSDYFGMDFVSMGFELEIGVILFLIHIAIFTALSFIVFRRQQIKN